MITSADTDSDVRTRSIRFGELEIAYDDRLLTPREWTLAQSDWATEVLPTVPEGPVLELCSGAGHIGLHAILHAPRPLVCVDDNSVACDYVRINAVGAGLAGLVDVRHGHLDAVLAPDERFSLVIADPPWVPSDAVERHPEDPRHAIDGGADGLALVRACMSTAAAHLVPGGVLLLQVGPGQEHTVGHEAGHHGLDLTEVRHAGARGALCRLDTAVA